MMRLFVQFALLFTVLAVHGAGLTRFAMNAVLCIDDAGLAVEGAADEGHCACDSEGEPEPEPPQLIAPDCLDITLSLDAQLQFASSDSASRKLAAPALLPAELPSLLSAGDTADDQPRLKRGRATADPPPAGPMLASLRTIILRT